MTETEAEFTARVIEMYRTRVSRAVEEGRSLNRVSEVEFCANIKFSRRHEKLSWQHHYNVASLAPQVADEPGAGTTTPPGGSHEPWEKFFWKKGSRPRPRSA
jgi:hypothetical protein